MSKRIGRLPFLSSRQLQISAAISLVFTATSVLAAPKLLVNEFYRAGNLTTTDEWIEVVLTEDMTAAQLEGFYIGDSASSTASKFSGYKFTNMASLAADFPAGTIIVMAGDTGPASDTTYDPSSGDWNLTLKTTGSNFTANGNGGDLAGTDVVYTDTDGTGGNTTISTDGFAVNWDSTPGTFGGNASVLIGVPSNNTGVVLASDLAGATTDTNWSVSIASGSLTPGLQNGGANTTYIDGLRAAFGAVPNLSINDVSMAEGDGGTTTYTFTVSIDATSASDVTFDVASVDGTATTADNDYDAIIAPATSGVITAGLTSTTIDVTVNGDTVIETDETFTVELSNVVGATVMDGSGLGTILDDDTPVWIINELQADPDATNGDANGDGSVSTTDDEFVELVNNSGADLDISGWVLSDGFGARHTFPPSTTVRANCSIVVFSGGTPTGGFGFAEVQTASSGALGLNNGGDTVTLNDGMTDVVSYVYGGEGGNDQSLTRDPDITGSDPLVQHSTATGSSGALFSPGTRIDGSNFAGCTPPPPNLSIDDVMQAETDGATTTFTFTVSIDATSASDVTFDYATMDGSATLADNDYVQITTTAGVITAGNTDTTIDVTVNGDTAAEGDENFSVELSNVMGAVVADGSGLGTILNDDASVPDLSINDVSALEGDGGTQTFTFSVTLSGPAPAGGVTFTYNTVDGSATTADSDYVAITPAFGNIAAGNSMTTIDVTVNGDTDAEPNEQFFINIGSASNANIVDGVGIGTIQNDDRYPIHLIQGAGSASPLAGQALPIAAAIVTAVAPDRFFIQMADADADMDPLTSEGIVVYTGAAPTVSVGDEVEVDGTIVEFFNLTEVSPTTGVAVISSGNPLPTPIEFSSVSGLPSTDPAMLSCPGTGPGGANNVDTNFECFEGMLVSIPEAIALQGNRRRTGDDYAEIQFSPRAERSLREPGVRYPDQPGPLNPAAGAWDGNPEVMEMDADLLGAVPNPTEIAGGARFSGTGVMTFDFGDYVFYPTSLVIDPATNLLPRPVEAPMAATELTIGSFNMLRFCDTVANEHVFECDGSGSGTNGEPDAAEVAAKAVRLSAYVRDVLLSPDVLGVQEVETQAVLDILATQIADDGGPTYTAYLVDGNDGGGIDVGYLVRDDRVKNAAVSQHLAAETWDDPDCSPCSVLLHDRPPLLLQADFQPAPGDALFPFAIINNHGRSRGGVDTGNDRVRAKRFTQALSIAGLVQEFQSATGAFNGMGTDSVPLVLVGDYNAYQFTDGYADVVGLIAGTYDDDANTCAPSNAVTDCKLGGANIVSPALQNLVLSVDADEQYSFIFTENFGAVMGYSTPNPARDVATGQVLDHVLVNHNAEPYVSMIGYGRANLDASINGADLGNGPDGAGGTQSSAAIGSSDHDGVVAYLETNCANLVITPGMEPDPDADGVCTIVDNCPTDANSDQTDANANDVGAACEATPSAVNDPDDVGGNYAATEDTALNVNAASGVLANDPADAEGDTLSAVKLSDPATGVLTLNADGSFAFTPATDVCDDVTPLTFTYSASDGEHDSPAATASILVGCVNDAPTISDIASPQMTDEETSVVVAFTINDVDSALACSAANLTATSSNATLMPVADIVFGGTAPNCTATLTPAVDQVGNSTIRITVSDGALEAFDEFVLIVSNVDDPAVLGDDSASVTEDDPATAIDVLGNDSDPDSPLLISGLTQPANGTVVVTGGGTGLTYEPDANYCNDGDTTDDFTYTANGQTANVLVTVTCVDDPTVAVDDAYATNQGVTIARVWIENDVDPDLKELVASVTQPANGIVAIESVLPIGGFYTPNPGYCNNGVTTDDFTYTLTGGSTATVRVTVVCNTVFADGFED